MIYLDHAATSFHKPDCVAKAVYAAIMHMGNAGRGAHEESLKASRLVFDTRQQLAELFGLQNPAQVAFTANSTESLNIAMQGLFSSGDHVITTVMEHNSVLRPLYLMEERGVRLSILPANALGNVSIEHMEHNICSSTKAIACTHASNLTGNVNDLQMIGKLCRQKGILFVVDASQSAGILPIDMAGMGIDVLCFTGHKSLMGPQGIGGICVKEGVCVRPLLVGGSGIHTFSKTHPYEMPAALEAGTLNGHGIAGLHAALSFLSQVGIDTIRSREEKLMRRFYEGVKEIDGVTVYGDFTGTQRAPIVTLNIRDFESGEVADELVQCYDIHTRAGGHCAPLMHESLGTREQGAVRFSMSFFNHEEEIDTAIDAVRKISLI